MKLEECLEIDVFENPPRVGKTYFETLDQPWDGNSHQISQWKSHRNSNRIPMFFSMGILMGIPMGIPVGIPMGIPIVMSMGIHIETPMGIPMGNPVGIPMGYPMGIPMGFPMGIPMGIPKGKCEFPSEFLYKLSQKFTWKLK